MKKSIAVFLFLFLFPIVSFASFDVSLKYGSRGSAVVELQDFLQDQVGYSGKIDGKFGFGTLKAVKAFQSANGLNVDGYFGSSSRTKANDILNTDLEASNSAEQTETGTVASISSVNGCAPGNAYSTSTGQPCSAIVQPIAGLPDGCIALSGYSITTGKKCSGELSQPVIDQSTQDKLTALNAQLQALTQQIQGQTSTLNSTLGTIATNTTPPPAPVVVVPPPVSTPDPLVFTKAPKFLYVGTLNENNIKGISSLNLSKVLYETNRPSKIVFGPVINNINNDGTVEWKDEEDSYQTGSTMVFESCGRHGGIGPDVDTYLKQYAPDTDTTCTIRAQSDDGATVEARLSVNTDSIIIPTKTSPVNY